MDQELLEDVVFLGRELDVLCATLHQPAHQVDAEIVAGELALRALLLQAVAEGRADAGEQLVGAERLGDIVVGAGIQPPHLRRLLPPPPPPPHPPPPPPPHPCPPRPTAT